MRFPELVRNRRSIRKFLDKPIPLETINELINDSTFAPSAGNGQPWKFIIVNNKDMLQRMSAESKKNILARIAANPDDYAKKYQGMLGNGRQVVEVLVGGDWSLSRRPAEGQVAAG